MQVAADEACGKGEGEGEEGAAAAEGQRGGEQRGQQQLGGYLCNSRYTVVCFVFCICINQFLLSVPWVSVDVFAFQV